MLIMIMIITEKKLNVNRTLALDYLLYYI